MEKEILTVFQHWQRYHPNYGSFQTRLFQAYEVADSANSRKLESVFPVWFSNPCLADTETPMKAK
jgi:hypothetical protein